MASIKRLSIDNGATSARVATDRRIAHIARELFSEITDHDRRMIETTINRLVVTYVEKHRDQVMLAEAYNDPDKFRRMARGIAWEAARICGLSDKVWEVRHFDPPISDREYVSRPKLTFSGKSCERCGDKFTRNDTVVEIIERSTRQRLIVHAESCWLIGDTVAREVTKH